MKSQMKKAYQYNAQGSPEEKEEKDETPEFKKGGRAKKHAHGGKVHGHAPKKNLGRKPRAAGGRNPYSTAKSESGGAAEDSEGKKDVTGAGAETELKVYHKGGKVKK